MTIHTHQFFNVAGTDGTLSLEVTDEGELANFSLSVWDDHIRDLIDQDDVSIAENLYWSGQHAFKELRQNECLPEPGLNPRDQSAKQELMEYISDWLEENFKR